MFTWLRNLFTPSVVRLQREYDAAKAEAVAAQAEAVIAVDTLRNELVNLEAAIDHPIDKSFNLKARANLRESYVEQLVAHAGGDLQPILHDYGEAVALLETVRKRRRFSIASRQRVWDRCGRTCAYCAEPIASWTGHDMHLDHVVPFSKGGTDDESNLVAACPECNGEKSGDEYDDDVIDAIL